LLDVLDQPAEVLLEFGAEAGAGIDRVAQQDPALGLLDVLLAELRGVELVRRLEQLVVLLELGALVVVRDHASGARGHLEGALELADAVELALLGDVVVEPEAAALHVGQIDDDVLGVARDLSVLDVLRMGEADFGDLLDQTDENGAGETVEIAAGQNAHGFPPSWFDEL